MGEEGFPAAVVGVCLGGPQSHWRFLPETHPEQRAGIELLAPNW